MKKDAKRVKMDLEYKNDSLYIGMLINDIQEVMIECDNVLNESSKALLVKKRLELIKLR
jgi:hypothetical protein